jgi:Holliday junction resolvase RusA-like endonuclease
MHHGGKGFYLAREAVAFKERLRAYALLAAHKAGWKMPKRGQECSVAFIVWNSPRHDVDSPTKFLLDSMQGIIYENDRYVRSVTSCRNNDGTEPRIEITVALLPTA